MSDTKQQEFHESRDHGKQNNIPARFICDDHVNDLHCNKNVKILLQNGGNPLRDLSFCMLFFS